MKKTAIAVGIGCMLVGGSSVAFASEGLGCSSGDQEVTTNTYSHNYNKTAKTHSAPMDSKDDMRMRIQTIVDRLSSDQLKRLLAVLPQYEKMIAPTHSRYWIIAELTTMIEAKISSAPTIVDLAVATPDLSILVDIVTKLGLAETLSGGEYTVFAPTNTAFEALLADLGMSYDELASNTELLKTVVLYHVLDGTVKANDVVGLTEGTLVPTIGGESVRVSNRNGVFVDDATVIATDIMASNGVVHLIDSLLLPPSVKATLGIASDRGEKDIVTTAVESNLFPTLVAAVKAAGLVETLQGDGPFTLYAPTEEAFADALHALGLTAAELLADKETLTAVLTYHVVPGFYTAEDIVGLDGPIISPTVNGATVTINPHNGSPMINDANIIQTNVYGTNGVIHVIDKVLLP